MQGRPPHLPASTVIRLRRSRFIEFALFLTIRNLPSKGKRAATGRVVGTPLTRRDSWVPHPFALFAKGATFDFPASSFRTPVSQDFPLSRPQSIQSTALTTFT